MPNIFHQSIEDILKTATAEQKILWNHVFLRFGERISISQLIYQGVSAGSEFLTYTPRKIFLAYDFAANGTAALGVASTGQVTFFDENNVQFYELFNVSVYWDATAANPRYITNLMRDQNIYFSRLTVNGITDQIKFIGYRITY